jgi:uncharacterized delta-60 repeat protein
LVAVCTVAILAPGQPAEARFGDFDPSFNGVGGAIPDVGSVESALEAVTTRPDGRPVAAGWAANAGVIVQRTNDGAADPSFGSSGVAPVVSADASTRLHGIALDGDGRIVVAGDQQAASLGPTTPIVRRFAANGAPDLSFAQELIPTEPGEAHAVAPLPDGKILVAGWYAPDSIPAVFFVARLLENGTLDRGFAGGGIAVARFEGEAHAEAMAVDQAGRIVLAGWTLVAGIRRPALARFDTAGVLDPTFGANGMLTLPDPGELRSVQIDGAGRVVAAGISGSAAVVTRRLTSGQPDLTFGMGGSTHGAWGAELHGLTLDGERAFVAGLAQAGPTGMLLGALDAAGNPDAGFGGAPPGWRTTAVGGLPTEALGVAPGPGGTLYAAGRIGDPGLPFIARTLPNAAPTAALAAPAQVAVDAAVTFDAGGSSDPEGEPLRYAFDLDGNGSFELDGGTNPVAARSFAAPGTYAVGVRVTDPRGAAADASRAITVTRASAPRPVLGKQGVARPLRGIVRYRLRGTRRFVRLTGLTAIPNGTEIDTRKGRVLLTVLHDASGRLDSARFHAGRFIFRQAKGRVPITTLKLSGGSFAACSAKAAVAASKKRGRRLWGAGKGRFRTRGRHGAATVRGTKWLTRDRCHGTLVRVVRGKVSVEGVGRSRARARVLEAGERRFVRAGRAR